MATTATRHLSVQPLGRCSVTAALFAQSANDIYLAMPEDAEGQFLHLILRALLRQRHNLECMLP